jgi:heavy metal translocating P-type ATPase
MVFAMLMAAADAPDPSRFKETDLYRRCLAAGVVPASAAAINDGEPAAPRSGISAEVLRPDDSSLGLDERIEGMWCPACAWVIGTALGRMDGVVQARCDFTTDRLHCRYNPAKVRPDEIRQALSRLGYRVAPGSGPSATDQPLRREFVRLALCALLSVNVMMLSWALYAGFFTPIDAEGIGYISWPIAIMATLVFLYGGGPILRKAWSGMRHGAPGMETLISLGAGSAYLYSLVNWLAGSLHLYFDTAAMLFTLLLLGKQLEGQAKRRVRQELEGFLSLQPAKVRLRAPGAPQGRYVAIAQLGLGDEFQVGPDEIVPADGRVTHGQARLDMAAITGEARPVAVATGDPVISGGRVVSGEITVQAQQVGVQSLLGQMIAVVSQSLGRKTTLETRTDRWLAWFVPLLAILAAATGIVAQWNGHSLDQSLVRAVTVLVIACPCALGIAIPLARIAGVSGAARRGILVKDFRAFEQAAQLDHVVLDKTGTVTLGRWSVEGIILQAAPSEEAALAVAMGLETGVDHAIGRAIMAHGQQLGIKPQSVEQVQPHADGLSGRWQDQAIQIGSRRFAALDTAPPIEPAPDSSLSEVVLSVAGRIYAIFYFGDTPRPGMADAVARFEQRGLWPHLISGDDETTTQAVATRIGIPNARGRLLPKDKADYIRNLQAAGQRVVMVGDGINDTPALSQADLAVAVYSGSPLAQHAAAVTLMRADPAQLLDFLHWAGQVNRKVRQNLWMALGYNLVSIPIAMAGLLTPLVAVTAMLLSSLTVIGNTLLLVRRGHRA